MTDEQVQTELLRMVCSRFMRLKKSTPRKRLVVKFKNPDAVTQLVRLGMVRSSGGAGNEEYLPSSASFAFSQDPDLGQMAKQAVVVVLNLLRLMYEAETEKQDFTFDDLREYARHAHGHADEDQLRLGLYLSSDFRIFNAWSMTPDSIEIGTFRIAESIVSMTNAEARWDEEMQGYANRMKPQAFQPAPKSEVVFASDGKKEPADRFDWELLHPEIQKVAQSRFETQHFADAVEAALKAVNERVRDIYRAERGEEKDGANLMHEAFSPKSPVLLLGDLTTISGRDMQIGYMQVFAGAMTGIRNPKAHGNVQIDAERAIHFLFLASLLMCKVDEAKIAAAMTPSVAVVQPRNPPASRSEPLSLTASITFHPVSVPGGGDWSRYQLKIRIENEGEQAASDYRLDVLFPDKFLDEGGSHTARVSDSQKPGYALFRVTNEMHGVKIVYPGERTGEVLTFHYAVAGEVIRERPRELDIPVIVTVYSGNMKPRVVRKTMSELLNSPQ